MCARVSITRNNPACTPCTWARTGRSPWGPSGSRRGIGAVPLCIPWCTAPPAVRPSRLEVRLRRQARGPRAPPPAQQQAHSRCRSQVAARRPPPCFPVRRFSGRSPPEAARPATRGCGVERNPRDPAIGHRCTCGPTVSSSIRGAGTLSADRDPNDSSARNGHCPREPTRSLLRSRESAALGLLARSTTPRFLMAFRAAARPQPAPVRCSLQGANQLEIQKVTVVSAVPIEPR